MAKNFEMHFNLLKKELNSITKNIHLVKCKSHDSIIRIINDIKNISEKSKAQFNNTNTNYKQYKPSIYLYPYYKEQQNDNKEIINKTHYQTINNCTITKSKFFLDKNNIINIKKNNYNKKNTIEFNTNYHLNETISSRVNNRRRRKIIKYEENNSNNKKNIQSISGIDKILYFNYNNKDFFNNKINIPNNYFRTKYKFNKNYNSINVTKIKRNYDKNILPQKEKKFVKEIRNIYNKYNKSKRDGDKYGYDKIIEWINELINKEGNNEENKYENFCKQLMKENNISNFSGFKSFAKNNINEEKSANYFIKDMKKILFKDIT